MKQFLTRLPHHIDPDRRRATNARVIAPWFCAARQWQQGRLRALTPDIVFRELDRVMVKGKSQPAPVYESFGRQDEVETAQLDELRMWVQCLRLHRSRLRHAAEVQLLNLRKHKIMQRLNRTSIKRTWELRRDLPAASWPGAQRFEAK